MNNTNYHPQRKNSFTYHVRRNSLQTLHKLKNYSIHQQQQNFRRSSTSFDKINKNIQQESINTKYQKQMDNNIYFNPHSRANYFKNLIDSYFDKSQNNAKINHNISSNNQILPKSSYLLRKNVLNKNNTTNNTLRKQKIKAKTSILFPINNSKQLQSLIPLQKFSKKTQKLQFSIRQIQQTSKISASQLLDQISQYTQSGNINQQKSMIPLQPMFPQALFLPKITEAVDDDYDEQTQITSRQQLLASDAFMRSQSNFSRLQQMKKLTYENSIIKLFTSVQNQKKYRIKQFKDYIFLRRHNRAIQYGAQSFWKPYKFHQLSLMIPYVYPLKDILFKILPHPTSPQFYYIQPKPLYFRFTANHCQQLILLFRQLIKDIHKISNKVINNKINLSNIFYLNGKLCISQWEYSAFKQQNKIQGNHFQSRVQPILKCQKQWLVSPQYLAPEILQSIQDFKKPFDLWQYDNSSDIYSIGLVFLQIITLIPMWMQFKTSVKSKIMKPREGLLTTPNRSTMRIIQKQRMLVSRMSTVLQRQLSQQQKNWKFFNILLRMIQPNRSKRISINQLMKQLQ